jgi:tetratricopeptide (TPR) repeat protein
VRQARRRPWSGGAVAGTVLGALLAAAGVGCAGIDPSLSYLERGEDALARGDFGDARDYFRYTLDVRPDQPRALLGLARSQSALGQGERALELFFTLEQVDSGLFRERARGDLALTLLQVADARLGRGDASEALRQLRRLQALDPAHPGLAEALPRVLVAASGELRVMGRTHEAEALFREATRTRPAPEEAVTALARALLEVEELDRAISVLSEALRRDPADPGARALLELALARRYPDPVCYPEFARCEPGS